MVTRAPLPCRFWAMSCALVPVPKTNTFLPRHAAPSSKQLECTTAPPKRSRVGISGMFGVPLTLVAMTMCRGRTSRTSPSAERSRAVHSPAAGS